MSSIPMTIGDTTHTSKTAARTHIRAILRGAKVGDRLSDQDAADVVDLVRRYHPHGGEKVGWGIDHVAVELSDQQQHGKSRGFYLYRTDGTSTDVSYDKCFKRRNPWADFVAACREEIAEQIIVYRNMCFSGRCEYTGEPVTLADIEVDHQPPRTFAAILREFLRVCGIDYTTVAIASGGDHSHGVRLGHFGIAVLWADWHLTYANLRIVSREANQGAIIEDARDTEDWRVEEWA